MRSSIAGCVACVIAFTVGPARATEECPHANVNEACCSGGYCMGGICYDSANNSSWCGACVPLTGPPCSVIQESSPCDDAGDVCTSIGDYDGTFDGGIRFGVARLACIGGAQPEAGPPDAAGNCYAPPSIDAGADQADAATTDAADRADATMTDAGADQADAAATDEGAGQADAAGVPRTGGDGGAADVGAAGPGTTAASRNGCSCHVAGALPAPSWLAVVGVTGLLGLRRRRHRTD